MSQMLKSSAAMGVAVIFSRLLGFAREAIYAWFMGDGPVASAFKLAFQVPNLFRRLLGEGALSAAFIPIFKEKEKNAGEAEMWRSANAVISGLIIAAAVIIALAMAGLTLLLNFSSFPGSTLAGKFGGEGLGDQTQLMLELLRLMFPYMLMVCLAAIFIGMLNARGYFFVPAMGTAILNLVMIASVFALPPFLGRSLEEQIFGVAIGVLLAGAAQAVYQLFSLKRQGFQYRWVSPWRNETVRQVVLKMIPGTLGVAAFQINVLVTNSVAFYLVDQRIVASFDYAVRLMELPQGVFGVSIATYLLPTLSGFAVDKKFDEFRATLGQAASYLVFVNLIASLFLVILAEPIVRLLFERGNFTAESTLRAAAALRYLAPGLIIFSLVNIMARAFYATGDTQTPMKISIFCLGINLIFGLILVWPYRQKGLGMANTISAAFNLTLLIYALRKRLKVLRFPELERSLVPLSFCGVATAFAAALSSRAWETSVGHANLAAKAGGVFVPIILGTAVYVSLSLSMRIPAAGEVKDLLVQRFRGKR